MARNLPSLKALRAFEAAARHQSFSAAAGELNVTHAAISRQVRELETWLGLSLFRRIHRGVVLTDPGARYAGVLGRSFDRIAAATEEVLRPDAAGLLRISVEVAFASRWLVPRLGRFRAAHPDIDVDIDQTDATADLSSGEAALAIRYGEGYWPGTRVTHLYDILIFPVCAPALLDGEHPLRAPADLRHHTLLHEDHPRWWAEWLHAVGVHDLDPSRGPRFSNMALALDAALSGQGVALGDNVVAKPDLDAGRLVRPFDQEVEFEAYYLVEPDVTPAHPTVEAFRTWILAEIAPYRDRAGSITD
jgi:LysR family transcriptional regulator, glycine cleavage system transcriptional activator